MKTDKLSQDLRKFFLACEINNVTKHAGYKPTPAYIDEAVKRANEIIKIQGLDLVAEKTIANTFIVKEAA